MILSKFIKVKPITKKYSQFPFQLEYIIIFIYYGESIGI